MASLYDLPLEGVTFVRPCGCNQGSDDSDTCILVGELPGAEVTAFALTTTTDPDREPIRATEEELDAFALGWARRRGLTLPA